jgi:hypothetical protein
MPNWCSNTLTVLGPAEALDEFVKRARREAKEGEEASDFSLERFIPTPEELISRPSPGGAMQNLYKAPADPKDDDWYSWRVRNWGTKWDVDAAITGLPGGPVVYSFSSAWAPPEPGIKAIAKLIPKLTFTLEYDEPGMNFSGILRVEGDQVLEEETAESQLTEEEED